MKKEFNNNVKPMKIGIKTYTLSKLFSLLRTVSLVIKNNNDDIIAENIGDKNHDKTIPDTPPI